MVLLIRSVVWTRGFLASLLSGHNGPQVSPAAAPRAVVVLPVRGMDPFLTRCIESLLDQNYSNYILRIIVDSKSDPSVPVIEQAINLYSSDRVEVEYLHSALETCGAKNSALIQIVESLEPEDSAIVVVDSDVIAYPDWLGDLMRPLLDPKVGVATGMCWYTPETSELGTLVRYMWNVGSVPEMFAFQVPFGGSVAYRRDVLEGGLAKRWSECLFDDCVVPSILKPLGLELKVVPRAIMANRESISLGNCFKFLRRQMLNATCYNPARTWILINGVAMAFSVFGAVGILATAVLHRDVTAIATAAFGILGFAAGMAGCLISLEMRLRPILRGSGQFVPPLPMKTGLVGGLTVSMYTAATICAYFVRRVSWRGLNYSRVGFDQFHLEEHCPFSAERVHAVEHASV
ncbi:MAG: glycosyltransferase [Planctomycetota bacterium]|nr:glycosyltransferase [Planctomycetota bacterium]